MSLGNSPSCPKHPDQKDFYTYEGKPSRCKACVRDQRQSWLEKKRQSAGSEGPADAPASGKAPTPVRPVRRAAEPRPVPERAKLDPSAYWHWSWGPRPEAKRGSPSTSPDAWGPYKGMTDDELRRAKSRRGQPYSFGTSVWLSPEEWQAREKWFEEYKNNLSRKHNRE